MKLFPILLFLVFLLSEYESVQGKVVQEFFEKLHKSGEKIREELHKTGEKVREDINKLFKPLKDRKNRINEGNADKVTFMEDFKTDKDKNIEVVTSSLKPPTTTESKLVSSTISPVPAESIIVFPTEAPVATTTKSSNATDKDGKENFSGGCLAGFQRTSDGRCMPTF